MISTFLKFLRFYEDKRIEGWPIFCQDNLVEWRMIFNLQNLHRTVTS